MCRRAPYRINLADLDIVAAVMSTTLVIPEILPGREVVEFLFPGDDDIYSAISGYQNDELRGNFRQFAANKAWCEKIAGVVAESGRPFCP